MRRGLLSSSGAVLAAAFLYLAAASGSALSSFTSYAWDDSFITYQYARNLAAGHGVRYNAADAEPTEGYSSPAHLLLTAGAIRLGADPLVASRALSLLCFLAVPFLVGLPLARLLGVPAAAACLAATALQVIALLSPATPFHLHLGMETHLFAAGLAALAGWAVGELDGAAARGRLRRVLTGAAAALFVVLARPEGLFLVGFLFAWLFLFRRFVPGEAAARNDRAYGEAAGLVAAGCLLYFAWKWRYFGYLLPNPYYVKSHDGLLGSSGALLPGLRHTAAFLRSCAPWFLGALAVIFGLREPGARRAALLAAFLPGLVFVLLYARAIHEAAPHARFEYPYLVFLELLLAGAACLVYRRFGARLFLPLAALVIPLHLTHPAVRAVAWRPAAWLGFTVDRADFLPATVGRELGRTGLGQRASVVTSAAGAIPWFSGFRTIDVAGLNDNTLSGRRPISVARAWEYIESRRGDVLCTSLPPASPDLLRAGRARDPVFSSPAVQEVLDTTSELRFYQDPQRVLEMLDREMLAIRDHYTFGGAYLVWNASWMQIIYVRRDSPHREAILAELARSERLDRETPMGPRYFVDPRSLRAAPAAAPGP
jgi:hypothetical protein